MSNPIILLYGRGCEYVLQPLEYYLEKWNTDFTVIDTLYNDPIESIQSLLGKEVIFITSYHPTLCSHYSKHYLQSTARHLSPLEVMDWIRPKLSFFIPHDLSLTFHTFETPYFSLFNYYCSVFEWEKAYLPAANVIQTGWIKHNDVWSAATELPESQACFLLSDFEFYRQNLGMEGFAKFFHFLKDLRIPLKFPMWNECEEYSSYLSDNGFVIIDPNVQTTNLIKNYSIIITNGTSSVIAEASYFNKKVINMVDTNLYSKEYLAKELANFENILFLKPDEIISQWPLAQSETQNHSTMIKKFDFDLIRSKIM